MSMLEEILEPVRRDCPDLCNLLVALDRIIEEKDIPENLQLALHIKNRSNKKFYLNLENMELADLVMDIAISVFRVTRKDGPVSVEEVLDFLGRTTVSELLQMAEVFDK